MSVSTYAPSEVSFKIYGMFEVGGYSSGSFITLRKNASTFSTVVGAQGTVARLHNVDDTYNVTISLAQSSFWNQIFTTILSLDNASLVGKFPFTLTDDSGDSLFYASTAWIDSPPEIVYSNGMEVRNWSLTCTSLVNNLAGNEDVSTVAEVILTALTLASSTASGGIGAL